MRLGDIPKGRWFHDPYLQIEGKVERQGMGSTVVRLHRPRAIVIHGETVAVVHFTKPEAVSSAWDVELGELQNRKH